MGQLPTGMVSGIVVVACSNGKVQGAFELSLQRECWVNLTILSISGALMDAT